jgi:Arc/MetJ-type ribon-helix-helix transcriptional regulator
MSELEKVSVNIGAMDLAYMDLLVDNSFYKDRTDFVRTAIRNQLSEHSDYIAKAMKEHETSDAINVAVTIGKHEVCREDLLTIIAQGSGKLKLIVLGSLHISEEVDLELALRTISSIKVYGIMKARNEIKNHFSRK